MNNPSDARSDSDGLEGPKVLRPGCAEPGCGVPPSIAVYKHANGGRACISHATDRGPKHRAAALAGESTRRQRVRFMPAGTPTPDLSDSKAIRSYIEDRLGRIERGELDKRAVDTNLVNIARQTHTDELLEKLESIEAILRARALGGTT